MHHIPSRYLVLIQVEPPFSKSPTCADAIATPPAQIDSPRQVSTSRKPPKAKTHLCHYRKCNGKSVCQSIWYAYGGSVKQTRGSISERTKDVIQSLPQTSPIPRVRKPRKRRAEEAAPTDGDSSFFFFASAFIPCNSYLIQGQDAA